MFAFRIFSLFYMLWKQRKEKEKEIKPLPLDFSFQNREWLSLGLCKVF